VDLYKKATGIIVGYNQAGEWLEYTVKVAKAGTYTMNASVASGGTTGSFKLSMDGKDITEEIAVPQATSGEDNFDEYNVVKADVELTEGEHILRFTVTGDWMDIDYIEFSDVGGGSKESISRDAHFAQKTAMPVNVFGMTGKFLGQVRLNGGASARDMSASLKESGFAQGMYMVRGSGIAQRIQVK
jgi:alpha-galactosidase